MRITRCEGCGLAEPLGAEERVLPVTISIGGSTNKFYREEHTADLCDDCISTMLHNYFSRPARGMLEMPAFIQPRGGVE